MKGGGSVRRQGQVPMRQRASVGRFSCLRKANRWACSSVKKKRHEQAQRKRARHRDRLLYVTSSYTYVTSSYTYVTRHVIETARMHATRRCHASAQGEPKLELRAGDLYVYDDVTYVYDDVTYSNLRKESPKLELRAGDLV